MAISIVLIILGVLYIVCGLWLLGIAAFNEGVKQVSLVNLIRNEAVVLKLTGLILIVAGIAISFSKKLIEPAVMKLRKS